VETQPHPASLRYLRDPYYLEEKHYKDRPYPVSSPAFTNVPLVGPILAATIGRLVKPTVRMHEKEWDGKEYTLYSPRLEPRGPGALPPPLPKDEYSLGNVFSKEANIFAEYTGLYGFVAKSAYQGLFPNTNSLGKEVDYQGSRQLDSFTRRYYEKELGAGVGHHPLVASTSDTRNHSAVLSSTKLLSPGQRDPHTATSWLPGDDYYTNFHKGDPFLKVDEGYARLPGEGYAALHPELKDVDPKTIQTSIKWPSWRMWLHTHVSTTPIGSASAGRPMTTATQNWRSSTRRSSPASRRHGSPSSACKIDTSPFQRTWSDLN